MDHCRAAKKVMRYLQGTKNYMLMDMVSYSDTDFAGCDGSHKSNMGMFSLWTVELFLGEVSRRL